MERASLALVFISEALEVVNAICKKAKLQARIKPTVLCSVIDKENSIEFPLDSVHYLYMKSNPNPSFYPTLPYE